MDPIQKPYTEDQFWLIYKSLPQQIKDVMWASETGDTIYQICVKNGIAQHHDDILQLCTQVFIGLLLPQNLQESIEQIEIPSKTAQQVARQLNGLVFYPVKPALEQLHRQVGEKKAGEVAISTPRHSDRADDYMVQAGAEQSSEEDDESVEEETKPSKQDTYREPID